MNLIGQFFLAGSPGWSCYSATRLLQRNLDGIFVIGMAY